MTMPPPPPSRTPDSFDHAFISRLTHDLRVPFAAVRSALYLLERHGAQVSGPREKKWLEAAGTSLGTFERLLRAVDLYAQVVSHQPKTGTNCDFPEIVNGALALAQDQNPGVSPVLEWDPSVPSTQTLDGSMFAVALRHLIDNAIRHAPAEQPPRIRVSALGHGWEVAVLNAGPAIPESEYPRLFTPFFHSQSHSGEQGAGLGLATARIAAAKAGCVLTHTRTDPHTVFRLRYPATDHNEG